MIHALIAFTKGFIVAHGYSGLFILTALEHFIFPIPVDMMIAFATSMGLVFRKVILVVFLAVLVGSFVGYYIGKFFGHPVARWLFGQKRLDQAEVFIKRWGFWGVVFAGLTPIPFKVVTITAGIFEMPLFKFLAGIIIGRMPRYAILGYAGALFFKTKFYATTQMSAVILGALQGVTEFLPISSSGHLALLEHFLKLPADITPGNLEYFDILLHGGSLLAILLYLWRDWLSLFREIYEMIKQRKIDHHSLAFKLALGTVPAIIAGLLFAGSMGFFRALPIIGFFMIGVALFYFFAERKPQEDGLDHVPLKKAVLIGLVQTVALLPGVSRSGMTIAAGRLFGIQREVAAKFSFMLGAVAILAANVYAMLSFRDGITPPPTSFILYGVVTAFVFSFGTIHFLLKFLRTHTLRPFGLYLLFLGTFILSFLWI